MLSLSASPSELAELGWVNISASGAGKAELGPEGAGLSLTRSPIFRLTHSCIAASFESSAATSLSSAPESPNALRASSSIAEASFRLRRAAAVSPRANMFSYRAIRDRAAPNEPDACMPACD